LAARGSPLRRQAFDPSAAERTLPSPPWQLVQESRTEGDACMVAASVLVWQSRQPVARRRGLGDACARAARERQGERGGREHHARPCRHQ
jgi:hypothetical protein